MATTMEFPTEPENDLTRPDSAASDWSDYRLPWLYDPNRHDHLPIEEQLTYFKQRDLKKAKIFNIAQRLFEQTRPRKRKIIAPPMRKPAGSLPEVTVQLQPLTSELKPQVHQERGDSELMQKVFKEHERVEDYQNWVDQRKQFRRDLENMGLSEEWLANKPDKTPLEQRVLRQMIDARTPRAVTPPLLIEEHLEGVLSDESPFVQRPAPLAIRTIERYLQSRKMRLIDLFQSVDKDKDWKVSREEFRNAIKGAKIPISDVLLEDLILALDTDLNDQLDYRELALGMGLWKIEKREKKKVKESKETSIKGSPERVSSKSTSPVKSQSASATPSPTKEPSEKPLDQTASAPSPTRIKSALSTISSQSSLGPPEPDLRLEQKILSSEEAMLDLRKRDREALARMLGKKLPKARSPQHSQEDRKTMIKTGDKAVDNHSRPSTLTGETADLVDQFRQLKLKEFNEIKRLCQENNVPLSQRLLERVLLFPPDKTHSQLKKQIRQPAMPLLSRTFADPPKRPKTPIEEKHKEMVRVSKTGKILIDSRHAYPSRHMVAPVPQKMNLSTGKAVITPSVDCWMTFEEYDRLTSHLAIRFTQLHGRVDSNAFWPGHLLDKIRLCMPNDETRTSSIFRSTKQKKRVNLGYDNNLLTWPISDSGFAVNMFETLDPYAHKYI